MPSWFAAAVAAVCALGTVFLLGVWVGAVLTQKALEATREIEVEPQNFTQYRHGPFQM